MGRSPTVRKFLWASSTALRRRGLSRSVVRCKHQQIALQAAETAYACSRTMEDFCRSARTRLRGSDRSECSGGSRATRRRLRIQAVTVLDGSGSVFND